ncbi:MAG: glycosyltransferase family 2 protein [Planctomycetes bacterium]|nr:glycosyltransferase family 2 protein [Planctomycetota bacterium]
MCTYNGASYLDRQMESFYQQSHDNWELWVSDDGSSDGTLDIIEQYRSRGKRITIVRGPSAGFARNFLTILRNERITAEYFAWSDQDDVWLPDKLSRAVSALQRRDRDIPLVYSGRTELIDADDRHIGFSPVFHKKPGFANALCQNIGGGNTMVFNRAARDVIRVGDVPEVKYHDWWAYQLISGVGGVLLYDPEPVLLYRQHGGNQVGENRSLSAKVRRLTTIFSGVYHTWNAANVEALSHRRHLLTPENAQTYDSFAAALRATSSFRRVMHLRRSKIYRQKPYEDWVFRFASLCRRYP